MLIEKLKISLFEFCQSVLMHLPFQIVFVSWSKARHLVGLLRQLYAVHQNYSRHFANILHPCMADNLFDMGSIVQVVKAQRPGPHPERRMARVLAVVVESV